MLVRQNINKPVGYIVWKKKPVCNSSHSIFKCWFTHLCLKSTNKSYIFKASLSLTWFCYNHLINLKYQATIFILSLQLLLNMYLLNLYSVFWTDVIFVCKNYGDSWFLSVSFIARSNIVWKICNCLYFLTIY